jgi:glutamate dehydrogenase
MTDEVAELVLANNRAQTEAISNAATNASSMLDVHRRYLAHLEQRGQLDRELEFLPDHEGFVDRRTAGGGLLRPEFAVLLAYTKTLLYDELLASDLPDDPWLSGELVRYFPTPLRDRYADEIREHRLRREIITTQVANELVNGSGTTFLFRLAEETGASVVDIVRAQLVAREVFDLRGVQAAVRDLDNTVPAAVQTGMLLEARRLVERGTRWLLRNLRRPIDIASTVETFAEGTATIGDQLPQHLRGADREVVLAAGHLRTGVVDEFDLHPPARRRVVALGPRALEVRGDGVVDRDGLQDRHDLVVAILAQTADRQEEVDLGGHAHPDPRGPRGAARRQRPPSVPGGLPRKATS